MSYRPLPLSCYCGEVPDRILEVGFTSDRNMVIHFWCSSCSRVLFVSKSLEECAQYCPAPDDTAIPLDHAGEDARFLRFRAESLAKPEVIRGGVWPQAGRPFEQLDSAIIVALRSGDQSQGFDGLRIVS